MHFVPLKKLFLILLCLIGVTLQAQTLNEHFNQRDQEEKKQKEFARKLFKDLRRGQVVESPDTIRYLLDRLPSFSIYKDNYICTGFDAGHRISANSADALFQLSFKQRVTKSKLPWNTHLFITYTQLAFWDIYRKSAPFNELNYNPTLALGKYFIHDNRLIGYGTFQFEHQSNGLDSIDSRDLNMITASFTHLYNDNIHWYAKVTAPIVLGLYSKDIFKYRGYVKVGGDFRSANDKFRSSFMLEKRGRWDFGFNFQLEVAYKIGNLDNIYAYAQYYSGYAQGILNYKQLQNYVRVGIVLKQDFITFH